MIIRQQRLKQFIIFIMLFILMLGIYEIESHAMLVDYGEPGNTLIRIRGLSSSDYSVDLLFYQADPLSEAQLTQRYNPYCSSSSYSDTQAVQDRDGYISLRNHGRLSNYSRYSMHTFLFNIEQTRTFKIMVIISNDYEIISEVVTLHPYVNEVIYDITDVMMVERVYNAGTLEVVPEIPIFNFSFYVDLVIKIIVSLFISMIILLIFRYEWKRTFTFMTYTIITMQVIWSLFTNTNLSYYISTFQWIIFICVGLISSGVVGYLFSKYVYEKKRWLNIMMFIIIPLISWWPAMYLSRLVLPYLLS